MVLGPVAFGGAPIWPSIESFDLADSVDRWRIAESLRDLGDLAVQEGDYKAAVKWYRDSLERNRVLGRQQTVADYLSGFADIALAIGQEERAQALFAGAEAIPQTIGQSFSATGIERSAAAQPPGLRYTIDELIAETQPGSGSVTRSACATGPD